MMIKADPGWGIAYENGTCAELIAWNDTGDPVVVDYATGKLALAETLGRVAAVKTPQGYRYPDVA